MFVLISQQNESVFLVFVISLTPIHFLIQRHLLECTCKTMQTHQPLLYNMLTTSSIQGIQVQIGEFFLHQSQRKSLQKCLHISDHVLAVRQLLKSYSNNHCKSLDPSFGVVFGKIKNLAGIQLLVVCLNSTFVASIFFT